MQNKTTFQLKSESALCVTIISLILSILALIAAFFSGFSIVFTMASFLLLIPAVILSVLLLTQDSLNLNIGLPIASLVCSKVASIIIVYFIYIEIIRFIAGSFKNFSFTN